MDELIASGARIHQPNIKATYNLGCSLRGHRNDQEVVWSLDFMPRRGKSVLALKEQLNFPTSQRILRGEGFTLEDGGDCFVNFMKHCIIDLTGFNCRIEKLDSKLQSKTLFMGNLYPKDQVYVMKMGLMDSGVADYQDENSWVEEDGFVFSMNNIRRILQCLLRDETDHTVSYSTLVCKILINLCSYMTYKVWPDLSTILYDVRMLQKNQFRSKDLIKVIGMDECFEDSDDKSKSYTLIDKDVTTCSTVLVNLGLDFDDMAERV